MTLSFLAMWVKTLPTQLNFHRGKKSTTFTHKNYFSIIFLINKHFKGEKPVPIWHCCTNAVIVFLDWNNIYFKTSHNNWFNMDDYYSCKDHWNFTMFTDAHWNGTMFTYAHWNFTMFTTDAKPVKDTMLFSFV